MFTFFAREKNLKKLVHRMSRYEIVAASIHAAINLQISEIVGEKSQFDINSVHANLIKQGKIINADVGPLRRLINFLSCYGIFNITDNESLFDSTLLSGALANKRVKESIAGLTESEWREQADLLEYFVNPAHSHKLTYMSSNVRVSVDNQSSALLIEAEKPEDLLIELANLHLLSRAIYTVAEFNLIDLISAGFDNIQKLAIRTNQRVDALTQLFKLLNRFQLVILCADEKLELTEISKTLMEGDNAVSIKAAANMANNNWWNSIGNLNAHIARSEVPYISTNGISVFDYLESNKTDRVKFDKGLANSDADQDFVVSQELNLDGINSLVDIGGGNGGLAAYLAERYPLIEVTLFEQPGTVDHLKRKISDNDTVQAGESAHIKRLAKCQLQPGNFLDPSENNGIPHHKQLYTIKGVLHDFKDEDVVVILKNIRKAMSATSELRIIERYVENDGKPHPNKVGDMQMMAFFGAKERSLEDYKRLAEKAGLSLDLSNANSCGDYNIITAKRADLSLTFSQPVQFSQSSLTIHGNSKPITTQQAVNKASSTSMTDKEVKSRTPEFS